MLNISIITPSYNQVNFIEHTLKSVIEQNYPNLEYIIIDGCSTDGSVEIIKKYNTQINYWVSEPDQGQADAINKGLKKATGDIVAWLNSDDMYMPDTLQFVSEYFDLHPEIDLIYGDVEQLYENGKTEIYRVKEFEPLDFLSRVSIHQPSVFWRRKLHVEIGYLDESLYYLMDYDLWMRIFFNYKTMKVNKLLSKFRIHGTSKTHNNPAGLYLEHRKIFCRFLLSCKKNKEIELLKRMCIWYNLENVFYNIKNVPEDLKIEKVLNNYIFNCIVQEYTFGNIFKTNRLIFNKENPIAFFKKIYIFAKNNIGISKFKNIIRKIF